MQGSLALWGWRCGTEMGTSPTGGDEGNGRPCQAHSEQTRVSQNLPPPWSGPTQEQGQEPPPSFQGPKERPPMWP